MTTWSIASLNARLERGEVTCARIVSEALARARDPGGEGARVFRVVYEQEAMEAAHAADIARPKGDHASPLAGLPISIKDNMAVAGEVNAAGSKVLLDSSREKDDAVVVQRLRRAGAAIVGRTNMSELAFTGVGHNPHFGTPSSIFDREAKRVPGGSSAGAAISVTDEMAAAALGTDTGGSVRIPAALNGLVGFKPTKRRVATEGVVPLSITLDCVGPLAANVADCAFVDTILSGDNHFELSGAGLALRLWQPSGFMLAGADTTVQRAFARAVRLLAGAGASVAEFDDDVLAMPALMASRGSIATAEAWERFGTVLEERWAEFDPHVAVRIERGAAMSAADHIANLRERAEFIARMDAVAAPYDAILAPTVAIAAPPLASLADDTEFARVNMLLLRNAAIANLADRPSISIPCHARDEPPVGLMLIGRTMEDGKLLQIGHSVEEILRAALR